MRPISHRAGEIPTPAPQTQSPLPDARRFSSDVRQSAILDALPAHIALLDTQGTIVWVNETWREFARANGFQDVDHGIGVNYLTVCDRTRGEESAEAHATAAGIRSVLSGAARTFSIEYSCHSPSKERWFTLTATRLGEAGGGGAVLTHGDVTAERQIEAHLRASVARFRQMAASIRDVFFSFDIASQRMLYVSPAFEKMWGRTSESLYANPDAWTDAIHPDDLTAVRELYENGMREGQFEIVHRILRPDGSVCWVEAKGFPVRDAAGRLIRVEGVVEDVTDRKRIAADLREASVALARFSETSSSSR